MEDNYRAYIELNRRVYNNNLHVKYGYGDRANSMHIDIAINFCSRLASYSRVDQLAADLRADLWMRSGAYYVEKGIFLLWSQVRGVSRT